jgi:serine/threonine-protein kinase
LGKQLGAGGNAIVFSAKAGTDRYAIKFLVNPDPKRFARFCDEVLVVTTTLKHSARVIPIIEHQLVESAKTPTPWYVMPVATTLRKHLASATDLDIIEAIAQVAEGLAELHAVNVAHRDIKPENLFFHEGTYRFGDFGIAKFPESAGLTTATEPMGPAGYMADEMVRDSSKADAFCADVFSLSKTLWVLLTKQKFPFLGQYHRRGRHSLDRLIPKSDWVHEPLDDLLEAGTHSVPDMRPSAAAFAEALRQLLAAQNDFSLSNPMQWAGAEALAFSIPCTRIEWTTTDLMVDVLRLLSRRKALNHCFFPSGGGLDVTGADPVESGEAIVLWHSEEKGYGTIVKPVRLTLERLAAGPYGSYATLETGPLNRLVTEGQVEWDEDLLRYDEHNYTEMPPDDEYWPKGTIRVSRYIKPGMFIIAPKGGVYNKVDSYQGRGNALGRDALRSMFESALQPPPSREAPFELKRQVRLVHERPSTGAFLHGLPLEKFKRALELDAAMAKARFEDRSDLRSPPSADYVKVKGGIKGFLESLSSAEFAELYTLFEFGRGDIANDDDLSKWIAVNARSAPDVQYLYEKFGNGYFLRALERFGMSPTGAWAGSR